MHAQPTRRRLSLPSPLAHGAALALAALFGWTAAPIGQDGESPAASAPQTAAPAAQVRPDDEPLPDFLAARVGGTLAISLDEYRDFLLARNGRRPLNELIYRRLVDQRAAEAGITVSPEEVEAAVQSSWSQLLDLRHGGDEQALAAELWNAGFRSEEHLANVRLEARRDLLENALCQRDRVLDEAVLRERFNLEYGVDGERVEVRHLLISKSKLRAELISLGRDPASLTDVVLDEAMLDRAQSLMEELEEGADFEVLAKVHSHDNSVRSNGGRIPGYNYARYGAPMAAAVRTAQVGKATGPVVTTAGVHLILVDSRTVTAFEDVVEGLRTGMAAEPASWEERSLLRSEMLGSTAIETY